MKVLHVIPSIAKCYGGPSTAILSMVSALNELDLDVSIAATNANGIEKPLQEKDLPATLPIHLFKHSFSESWKVSFEMMTWLNRHVSEYDLVHIHAIWSFSTAVAAHACIRQNVPYIIRSAGMLSDYSWNHKGVKKRLYWLLLEKKTIAHASALHATSQQEKQDILRVYPHEKRVFIIPNGVDESAFTYPVEDRIAELQKIQIQDDIPTILFLSRLHPVKGIVDRLLPAVSKMTTECQLLVVGGEDTHDPGYKEQIVETINVLELEDKVFLFNPVTGDERWPLFDFADIFVLPSHSENFGIVIIEAMARGCPVVVTPEVQIAPLVVQAKAGLVVNGEVQNLAYALDKLLADNELRNRMNLAGKKYARKHLAWSNISKQISSMYETVLT